MRKFQTNSLTFQILVTALVAFCYHFSNIHAEDDAVSFARNSTNHFIIKLIKEQNENEFLFSPIALEAILSLIRSGGNANYNDELDNVLPHSKTTLRDFLKKYTNTEVLNITQRIYVLQGYSLSPQFKTASVEAFPNTQDFYLSKEEEIKAIDDWRETHKNMVSTNILAINVFRETMSPLEIINIMEFKNDWLMPFDKTRTTRGRFYISNTIVPNTPMMHRRGYYLFADMPELNCTALRMYYKDGSSMLILLPRSRYGLPELITSLTPDLIETLNNRMTMTDVRVTLPKLRVDAFEMRLEEMLKAVGIRRIFSPSTPLNRLVEQFESIYLHGIKTVSTFQVDELGTDVERGEVPNIPVKVPEIRNDAPFPVSKLVQTFNANKGFLYIIQHSTGTPLLVGSYYGLN